MNPKTRRSAAADHTSTEGLWLLWRISWLHDTAVHQRCQIGILSILQPISFSGCRLQTLIRLQLKRVQRLLVILQLICCIILCYYSKWCTSQILKRATFWARQVLDDQMIWRSSDVCRHFKVADWRGVLWSFSLKAAINSFYHPPVPPSSF